jgi:hypothetical protein
MDRVQLIVRLLCLAVLMVVAANDIATAQNFPTFIGGSVMISSQGSPKFGNVGPSFPSSGVGGTGVGATGEIGRFLARPISIAFEFSVPNRFESVKQVDYFGSSRTDNRHRDVILSGVVGFSMNNSGKAHLAFVGGPSFVREDTLQRKAVQLGPSYPLAGNFGPYGPETRLTRWTMGIASGVGVGVDVSRHVSIVPNLRMYWISRAALGGSASGRLGLSSFVFRLGVGVRATF